MKFHSLFNIYNYNMTEIKPKTTCYMNNFEKAKVITARSLQLCYGNEPLIDINPNEPYDTIKIAEKELELGLLDLVTRRTLPNGEIEDWKASNMVIPE